MIADKTAFKELTAGLGVPNAAFSALEDCLQTAAKTGRLDDVLRWSGQKGSALEDYPGLNGVVLAVDYEPEFTGAPPELRGKPGFTSKTFDPKPAWTACALDIKDEPDVAAKVWINLKSPVLGFRYRVELPLRALLKTKRKAPGKYAVYLHRLQDTDGTNWQYYGITKRGWRLRFMGRAKEGSNTRRLFPRKLSALVDRLANGGDGPALDGMYHVLCAYGLPKDQAEDTEEYLVEKYSLRANFEHGLNMIPGGKAWIKAMNVLGLTIPPVNTMERETLLDQYLQQHPRVGVENPSVEAAWEDPEPAQVAVRQLHPAGAQPAV